MADRDPRLWACGWTVGQEHLDPKPREPTELSIRLGELLSKPIEVKVTGDPYSSPRSALEQGGVDGRHERLASDLITLGSIATPGLAALQAGSGVKAAPLMCKLIVDMMSPFQEAADCIINHQLSEAGVVIWP
ncbi:hypothetical protein [Sorangium sp. So ce1000]|uniref:hypothetical protein n=1 Tax=Sorangium sp. So ce1000 TaxID=3133325 RepID=UPI003F6287B1